jgi:hypothetical protein
MPKSFQMSENFVRNHGGFNSLMMFLRLCYKEPDLEAIAKTIKRTTAQACRLRMGICERVWRPRRGTIEFVEFQIGFLEREAKRRGEFIDEVLKKDVELQLIMGKSLKWIKS